MHVNIQVLLSQKRFAKRVGIDDFMLFVDMLCLPGPCTKSIFTKRPCTFSSEQIDQAPLS